MKLRSDKTLRPMRADMDGFTVRSARARDFSFWRRTLGSSRLEFAGKMVSGSAFVIMRGEEYAGLVYHTLLWDSIPLLNMVFVRRSFRGQGAGAFAVDFWEKLMRMRGHSAVLVCVPSDMKHQHFFRSRGYTDCGSLSLKKNGEAMPADLMLVKYL